MNGVWGRPRIVYDVHIIIGRVTSYISWNDKGVASMAINAIVMDLVHFEVPFYCLAMDVLRVAADTLNIVMRVEGVTMDVTVVAKDMVGVTLDMILSCLNQFWKICQTQDCALQERAAMAPEQQGCLICVPLTATTVAEMRSQMDMAKSNGADVVELRVDHMSEFDVSADLPALLSARPLPVIVTARAQWEGGLWKGNEETRQDVLLHAVNLGAEYVDVEFKVAEEFIKKIMGTKKATVQTKIIVSNHNWECTPSEAAIGSTLEQMQSTGADILKFVTTAQDITDASRVFRSLSTLQVPTIGLVMGSKGVISRLLSPKFGGYLTFGALNKGQESAPGQPTVQELAQVYRVGRVGQNTKVFGVVGNPIYHSKSPIIFNTAFEACGIDAVFVPFLVDNLKDFLSGYGSPDFAGFSVTIPHKEEALNLCDVVDPIAKEIGAVNTVVRKEDGKLYGYNTDCDGALMAIEDGLRVAGLAASEESPLKGKLVVVIGAGGAGKALAYGAKVRGARVAVANRNYERAMALANMVGGEAIALEKLVDFRPETGMVLANSTSIGMQPNIGVSPIPKDALSSYCLVFDAVYTPKDTLLLKDAADVGAVTVSGEEMFFRQAFRQFQHFTNLSAPEAVMWDAIAKRTLVLKD